MSRYIDADALDIVYEDGDMTCVRNLDAMPTVDAVPVVRCGECKHWEAFKNGVNGWCNRHDVPQSSFWFCADGERKDGEG